MTFVVGHYDSCAIKERGVTMLEPLEPGGHFGKRVNTPCTCGGIPRAGGSHVPLSTEVERVGVCGSGERRRSSDVLVE